MNDDDERLSNCCGWAEDEYYNSDSGICGGCRDHCEYLTDAEFEAEENET